MRRKTRKKITKGIIISSIILAVILLLFAIVFVVNKTKKVKKSYDDGIVCKNLFTEITIDVASKKVKRDNFDTTFNDEFDVSKEQEDLAFSSVEEMRNLLSNSVFDITVNDQVITIKDKYQTKNLIVEADDIEEKVKGEEIIKLQDNVYILNFYSEKLTKEMYSFYQNKRYIKNIYYDEIYIDKPINDISQTMYGESQVDLKGYHSLGVTTMGIDNYKNIINENGNPKDVVIATIGYGMNINNEIFENKIDDNYYNYILNNKDVSETIPQGSRIGEVLADSSTGNIKLMPLVTVTEEGYTALSCIIKAISQAIKKSDVICYELINPQNGAIDLMMEEAFNKNIPVCAVSTNGVENYPAKHRKTIATSSVDRNFDLASYSSKGDFIDFAAPSTDIEEIFKKNSTVSRWSGPEYSNAQIAAIIALIKTYNKDATVLDIYKFLVNFSVDLGDDGKDQSFGFGAPNFTNITISDIDKQSPEFGEITYDNEQWELLKQVKILATDNIRIYDWAVTENENNPQDSDWQGLEQVMPTLDVTKEINQNGKYIIWIRDSAGNTINKEIEINKIDTEGPQVAYEINKDNIAEGYVTINVTAEDTASGVSDNPFSWDKITWSKENNTRVIKKNGRYNIYVSDNLGNISTKEILVDCFPQEGIFELGEGNVITSVKVPADWTENINNKVQIVLNKEIDIIGWQITTTPTSPDTFVPVDRPNSSETNQTETQSEGYDLPNNISINNRNQNNTTQNSNENNTSSQNMQANNIDPNTVNTTNTQNVANQNNTANTQNATNQTNTSNAQNATRENIPAPPREPVTITIALETNKIYYLWVKDSNRSLKCSGTKN